MEAPLKLGPRPALNGLRGVAVLLVIASHTGLLTNGFVGVDLFFVLSGFLITCLLCEEWDRHGRISFARFWQRRALRLLPALLIAVCAFVALEAVHAFVQAWTVTESGLSSLTFTTNWVVAFGGWHGAGPMEVTWSLAQEAQFYLLWPVALAVMLARRVPVVRQALYLALAICVLLVLGLLVGFDPYYNPLWRGTELGAGCLTAIVWRHQLLPSRHWLAWIGAAWLVTALAIGATSWSGRAWLYLGTALFAAPLILSLVNHEDALAARLLTNPALCFVGVISYGLYLYHSLVIEAVQHYLPGAMVPQALLEFSLSIVVAALSWWLVEARLLRARPRAAQRPAQPILTTLR